MSAPIRTRKADCWSNPDPREPPEPGRLSAELSLFVSQRPAREWAHGWTVRLCCGTETIFDTHGGEALEPALGHAMRAAQDWCRAHAA